MMTNGRERTRSLLLAVFLAQASSLFAATTVSPTYSDGKYMGCTFIYQDGSGSTVSPAVIGEDFCKLIADVRKEMEEDKKKTRRFSGGVFADGLTDERFALQPIDESRYQIVNDVRARDRFAVGIGLFAHFGARQPDERRFAWMPMTVGIGAAERADFRILAGSSVLIGAKAFVTAGLSVGRTARLPTGVHVRDAVTDVRVLNDLPRRYEVSWSVGVSLALNP